MGYHMRCLVLLVAAAAWCPCALAQQTAENSPTETAYAIVNYVNVADGRDADYLALQQTVWKTIHQARLKDGIISGWYLYKVDNDADNRRDYDYVTVEFYDTFAKLENPCPEDYLAAGFAKHELQEHVRKTMACRDLIRSEVWKSEAITMADRRAEKPFIVVHYMQPTSGHESAYRDTELNVFRKLHQARIDAGVMNGWLFFARRFPGGSQIPYQFATVNIFSSQEEFQVSWPKEILDPVVQRLSEERRAALAAMPQLRTLVRQDILTLVDHVAAD